MNKIVAKNMNFQIARYRAIEYSWKYTGRCLNVPSRIVSILFVNSGKAVILHAYDHYVTLSK